MGIENRAFDLSGTDHNSPAQQEGVNVPNVNCLSYALFALGILKQEKLVDPNFQYFEVCGFFRNAANIDEADAVVIEHVEYMYPQLYHIVVVDKGDPTFVTHRPATGKEIMREPLVDALLPYQELLAPGKVRQRELKVSRPIWRVTADEIRRVWF